MSFNLQNVLVSETLGREMHKMAKWIEDGISVAKVIRDAFVKGREGSRDEPSEPTSFDATVKEEPPEDEIRISGTSGTSAASAEDVEQKLYCLQACNQRLFYNEKGKLKVPNLAQEQLSEKAVEMIGYVQKAQLVLDSYAQKVDWDNLGNVKFSGIDKVLSKRDTEDKDDYDSVSLPSHFAIEVANKNALIVVPKRRSTAANLLLDAPTCCGGAKIKEDVVLVVPIERRHFR